MKFKISYLFSSILCLLVSYSSCSKDANQYRCEKIIREKIMIFLSNTRWCNNNYKILNDVTEAVCVQRTNCYEIYGRNNNWKGLLPFRNTYCVQDLYDEYVRRNGNIIVDVMINSENRYWFDKPNCSKVYACPQFKGFKFCN